MREDTPVLVLLHPFPFHAGTYDDDAKAFAAEGLRVIAPNVRGFGGTPPPDGRLTIEGMADDVVAELDTRGVHGPVVVVGISMGGYVALSLARRHPGRLAGLVLADTRAEAETDEGRKNRDAIIARVREGDLVEYLESLLPMQLTKATIASRPDVVARVRALGRAATNEAVARAQEALRDRPDARDVLPTVRVPTAVIVGAEDVVTPPAMVKSLADAIPGATFEVIPGAAHFPNLEAPAAFRAAVLRLVARTR